MPPRRACSSPTMPVSPTRSTRRSTRALALLPRKKIAEAQLARLRRHHRGRQARRCRRPVRPHRARASRDRHRRSRGAAGTRAPCRRHLPRPRTRPRPWATTSPGPTMCCRPRARRAFPPAFRCSISSSARRFCPARRRPSPNSGPTPSRWPKPRGWTPMPAPSPRVSTAARKLSDGGELEHRASPRSSSTKRSVLRRTREIEQEREIAIYDLLEANYFAPADAPDGPYRSGAWRSRRTGWSSTSARPAASPCAR